MYVRNVVIYFILCFKESEKYCGLTTVFVCFFFSKQSLDGSLVKDYFVVNLI